MLFLSKLLSAAAAPLGSIVLMNTAALILLLFKRYRISLILFSVSLLYLFTASLPLISNFAVYTLESRYCRSRLPDTAEAIVVLGGATRPAVPPSEYPEINSAGDRLLHTARLYRKGKAQVAVATGGAIPFLSGHSVYEAETMKRILTRSLDLPEDSVLTEVESKNTRDHPLFIKELFAERGIKKDIILVTSAMHMPRAVSAFRSEGFTVYPAQTDHNSVEDPEMRLFLFLPSYAAFCNFHKAVHEYQGLSVYKIMGWI